MTEPVLSRPGRPIRSPCGCVAHVRRDSAHALQQVVGNGGQLLCRDAERRPGDADRRYWKPLGIQKWYSDTAQPFFELLVIHGIAAATRLLHLRAQGLGSRNGAMRKAFEACAAHNLGSAILRQERQNRLPHGRAVYRIAGADTGDHAN